MIKEERDSWTRKFCGGGWQRSTSGERISNFDNSTPEAIVDAFPPASEEWVVGARREETIVPFFQRATSSRPRPLPHLFHGAIDRARGIQAINSSAVYHATLQRGLSTRVSRTMWGVDGAVVRCAMSRSATAGPDETPIGWLGWRGLRVYLEQQPRQQHDNVCRRDTESPPRK